MKDKSINPAHIGLPKRPAGAFRQYHYGDTREEVEAAFVARLGYQPEIVMLVDTSTTDNPNPAWIAGPVHSTIGETHA